LRGLDPTAPDMLLLRSLLFNAAFYLMTAALLILPLPVYFILPQAFAMWVVRTWARAGIWLLRVLAGTRLEVRGREHIPASASIVAAKHQSAFETFALVPQFRNPTFVIKRELKWLPIFGQYTVKAGMIHVDRAAGISALRYIASRARTEIGKGRDVIIFPEGTRRPPGAPPDYHPGVAHLYRALGVNVVPVALNSGVFWPRRTFTRHPGTIVIEFLPPIPAGLDARKFMARLQSDIETASERLMLEARGVRSPSPTDLGLARDQQLSVPKSGKPDLGAGEGDRPSGVRRS
jgi:1-acyl-sn-glycerol-3-phosphate acyltransferase